MAQKSTQKDTVKKVLKYLKRYNLLLALSLIFAMVIVMLTLYVPILIGRAIDAIIYEGIDFSLIFHNLTIVVVVVLITAVAQWLMNTINNKITYNIVRDIRD